MAVKLEQLVIELVVENKKLSQDLRKSSEATRKAMSSMTKTTKEWSQESEKSVSKFSKVMETAAGFVIGTLAVKAFEKLSGAATALFNTLVTEGITAAQAQEDAIQRLNTALALSGEFSSETSKDIQEYASALQEASKFGDEVILENAALIQSLGGLSAEALKPATQAALDMAAALGIDLKSAALLVGKAAAGEISSFSRYGVIIEKGDTAAESFANTLEALNSKFGGAAAAQIKTYSGATQQLQNTFGDLTEQIGFAVTQNQAVLNVIAAVTGAVKGGEGALKDNTVAMKTLVAQGVVVAIEALSIFVNVLDVVLRAGKATFSGLEARVTSWAGLTARALNLVGAVSDETVAALDKRLVGALESVEEATSGESFLGNISDQLVIVKEAAEKGLGAVKEGAEAIPEPINKAKQAVEEFTEAQKKAAEDGVKLSETLILQLQGDNELRSELLAERLANEQELLNDAREQKLISEEEFIAASEQLQANADAAEKTRKDKMDKADKKRIEAEKKTQEKRWSTLTALQGSNLKVAADLGKAAAVANTLVTTPEAAMQAYKSLVGIPLVGPALAGVAYAGAIAQGASTISQIQGVGFARGIDEVPGIGFSDTFPARLAAGERVVPKDTNKDLKEFLNGGDRGMQQGGELTISLELKDDLIDFVETKLIERGRFNTSLQGA